MLSPAGEIAVEIGGFSLLLLLTAMVVARLCVLHGITVLYEVIPGPPWDMMGSVSGVSAVYVGLSTSSSIEMLRKLFGPLKQH